MANAPDKVDIHMPLFVGDYLADTTDLTTEEHGAYLLILMSMWRGRGVITSDHAKLARVTKLSPTRWREAWETLTRFFDVDGETMRQKRLGRELEKALGRKKAASESGTRGAAKRWGGHGDPIGNPTGEAMAKSSPIDSSLSPSSGSDPQPPAGAPDPMPPAPDTDTMSRLHPADSGASLARLFGAIRTQVTGAGFEWQGNPAQPEKAATFAASITAAEAWADVEPTIRSFWQQAKAGKLRNADQILRNPSFAFGCWCSEFHGLREALHGKAPAAPPDTSAHRCEWHKSPGTSRKPAHRPDPSCTDCRHLTAAGGKRESEPTPVVPYAPAIPHAPWPEVARAEAVELRKAIRPPAPPPKRLTILLEGDTEPKAAGGTG